MDRKLWLATAGSAWLLASCAGAPPQPAPETQPAKQAPAVQERQAQPPAGKPSKGDSRGQAATPAQPSGARSSAGAQQPQAEKAGERSGAPAAQEDRRSAREHVLEAMRLLDKGEPEAARPELTSALRQEPGNETASSLLKQLDADPEEMLGKEHFNYTVQGGDTLSKIAKRFLNDENKFYILARYNGLQVPGDLSSGQTLKIPGKRPAPPQPKSPPPAKEPAPPPAAKEPAQPPPAAKPPPKAPAKEASSEKEKAAAVEALYKKALAAYRRQDLAETIRLCDKALEIDPDNEKVKLRRAEALELQEKMKNLK